MKKLTKELSSWSLTLQQLRWVEISGRNFMNFHRKKPLEAIMRWFHDQPGESQMHFVVLLNCSNKHALLPVSLSVPTWFRHLDHFLALRKWNWSRNSQEKCVAFGPKYPGLKDVRWVRYDGMPLGWSNIARAPFLYMNLAYRIYSVFTFLLAFRCVCVWSFVQSKPNARKLGDPFRNRPPPQKKLQQKMTKCQPHQLHVQ